MGRRTVAADSQPQFRPIAYTLNWERIHTIPALRIVEGGGRATTTVGEVLREALPGWFRKEGAEHDRSPAPVPVTAGTGINSLRIDAANGTITVDGVGDGFLGRQVLEVVLQVLRAQAGSNHTAELFLFEQGFFTYQDIYGDEFYFFMRVGESLVPETVRLHDLCEHKLDKTILAPARWCEDGLWARPETEGVLCWWYRRFYTETRQGQMLLLRPNAPLYHYYPPERDEAERTALLRAITSRLGRLELLIFVAGLVWLVRGCSWLR